MIPGKTRRITSSKDSSWEIRVPHVMRDLLFDSFFLSTFGGFRVKVTGDCQLVSSSATRMRVSNVGLEPGSKRTWMSPTASGASPNEGPTHGSCSASRFVSVACQQVSSSPFRLSQP